MLAPQKNRAGQRTYRKRDVEMVLRIKELLYEDQYTIAGAKKKLTGELRGASKLKVVTPEMGAQAAPEAPPALPQPQLVPPTQPPTDEPAPRAFAEALPAAPPPDRPAPAEPEPPLTSDRRAALRRLEEQLRDLLLILKSDARPPRPGR